MATNFPKPQLVSPLTTVMVKRGLTPIDVELMELTIVDKETAEAETKMRMPWLENAQRIPYFDIDGHPVMDPKTGVHFCRYRLEPNPNWKFPPDWHHLRYTQPKGSASHICYVPRCAEVNWLAVAADTSEAVMITEGEYKSLAACKRGIPTIGLGGINMIAPASPKMTVPMDVMNWVNRKAVICFDAHETSTEAEPLRVAHEKKAALALANKFSTMGSSPFIVYIAKTQTFLKQEPRVKMGVDDFFEAGGTVDELLDTMEPVEVESLVLAEMIRDWCIYSGSKPFFMDRATGKNKHSYGDFVNVIVANKVIKFQDENKKYKEKPAAESFRKLPDGIRPVFNKMLFDPQSEFGLDMERRTFNTWEGMRTQPAMKGPDELARDVAIWRKYLAGLVGTQWVDFVEKWVAHLIQRPWEKTTIALVLGGKTEGTGKSLLGAIIGALAGEQYRASGNFDDFFGDYKGNNLESKLLIQIEESEGVTHAKLARLKDFITNPRVNISIKFVPDYTIDNLSRVIITSNALNPVKMEETSRRFFGGRTPLTKAQVDGVDGQEGWKVWCGREVWERFCLDKSTDGDWPRRHLMYHLANVVDLRSWEANATPPVTEEMEDMIEATRDAEDLGMVELYGQLLDSVDGYWVLHKSVQALNNSLWAKFIDYVKVKGGASLLMETRAFGERTTVRVLCRPGVVVPTKEESKGVGKTRTVVDVTAWNIAGGGDGAALIRNKDALIKALEMVGPVLRLSDDNITAVRRYAGKSGKF